MGMSVFNYWLASWIAQILQFMFSVLLIMLVFKVFNAFTLIGSNIFLTIFIFIIGGSVSICFNFFFVNLFSKIQSYFSAFSLINVLGSNFSFFMGIMLYIGTGKLPFAANLLHLVPNYTLMMGIFLLGVEDSYRIQSIAKCSISVHGCSESSNESDGTNSELFQLLFFGFLASLFWFFIAYLQEKGAFKNFRRSRNNQRADENANMQASIDTDVLREKQRISTISNLDDQIIVKDIRKTYFDVSQLTGAHQAKYAANGVSFGVLKGQCFGLLGPNGAGKSTTVNQIIGDDVPDKGEVYVSGKNVLMDQNYRKRFGFCPQSQGLFENLTCAEHLRFYLL
jgi:ATP-binding cassette, subfamily A (ABC1), member 3